MEQNYEYFSLQPESTTEGLVYSNKQNRKKIAPKKVPNVCFSWGILVK